MIKVTSRDLNDRYCHCCEQTIYPHIDLFRGASGKQLCMDCVKDVQQAMKDELTTAVKEKAKFNYPYTDDNDSA